MSIIIYYIYKFLFVLTSSLSRTGTWMMTGNGVMHNGTTILDEYGHNLDRLKVRIHLQHSFLLL